MVVLLTLSCGRTRACSLLNDFMHNALVEERYKFVVENFDDVNKRVIHKHR